MRYDLEQLKKYKKDQLINIIDSICDTFNKQQQYWQNFKKDTERKEDMLRQEIEYAKDEGYRKFVEGNKEYIERFIGEFIKEKVSVEIEESDYNWFKIQMYVDGEQGQCSQSIHIGDYEFDD